MTTTTEILTDRYGDPVECLDDHGEGTCCGPVGFHAVPGGTAIARCDGHFAARLDRYEASDLERYADSDVPPAWFHASYGGVNEYGERWDDDY